VDEEEEGTRREKREIKRINGEAPAKRNAGTRRRQPSPPSLHPLPPVPPPSLPPPPPGGDRKAKLIRNVSLREREGKSRESPRDEDGDDVNDDGDRERKRKREVGRRVGERSRDEGTTNDDEEEGKSAPPAVLLCYCGTRESRAAGAVAAVGGTGESLRSGRGRRPCSSSREVCVCGGGGARETGRLLVCKTKNPAPPSYSCINGIKAHLHISV